MKGFEKLSCTVISNPIEAIRQELNKRVFFSFMVMLLLLLEAAAALTAVATKAHRGHFLRPR